VWSAIRPFTAARLRVRFHLRVIAAPVVYMIQSSRALFRRIRSRPWHRTWGHRNSAIAGGAAVGEELGDSSRLPKFS